MSRYQKLSDILAHSVSPVLCRGHHEDTPSGLELDYCIPVANVATRSQLRSASRHQVVVPHYNTSTFGRLAFSVTGPTVWNLLPDKLRDPSTVSVASLKHSCLQTRIGVHSALEFFC